MCPTPWPWPPSPQVWMLWQNCQAEDWPRNTGRHPPGLLVFSLSSSTGLGPAGRAWEASPAIPAPTQGLHGGGVSDEQGREPRHPGAKV